MKTNGKQDDKFLRDVIFSNFDCRVLDDVVVWIRENLEPDEVFEKEQLKQWAEESGFLKGDV